MRRKKFHIFTCEWTISHLIGHRHHPKTQHIPTFWLCSANHHHTSQLIDQGHPFMIGIPGPSLTPSLSRALLFSIPLSTARAKSRLELIERRPPHPCSLRQRALARQDHRRDRWSCPCQMTSSAHAACDHKGVASGGAMRKFWVGRTGVVDSTKCV